MPTPEPRREPRPTVARPAPPSGVRRDDVLLRALRAAAKHGSFEARVQTLLEHARRALGAERASLWILAGAELECAVVCPDATPARRIAADTSWLETLGAGRADLQHDGAAHPVRRAFGGEPGLVLEAPVFDATDRVGLIAFEQRPGHGTVDAADLALAAAIADRTAVLLERRRRDAAGTSLADCEAQLHEAQRMQALGRLTTGVAHDFNNALTAILGGVQLVADGLPVESELQATASRTLDSIEFAAELARQLLDFGRGDQGDRQEVGLDDVIDRIGQLLRTLLGDRRHLELRLDARSERVHAAPTRLAQVVLNLVSNARDALPDGGTVTVTTVASGDQVVLRVADDGVGIPANVMSRIFEPLFTTKPIGQGCGLGLATVRHVVDELGGSIAVESEPGAGTAFEIRLPRA